MPDPIVLARLARVRGAAARSSTWWGRALVRSFEELTVEADDLVAARALARSGRLGAIVVLEAMASAVVDPGSEGPLMAQVKVDRLDAEALDDVRPRGRPRERARRRPRGRRPARRPGRARRRGRRRAASPGPATSTPRASATPGRSRACTPWRCSTSWPGRSTVIPTCCCSCAVAPARPCSPRSQHAGVRWHHAGPRGARGGADPGGPGAGAGRGRPGGPRAGRCLGRGVRRSGQPAALSRVAEAVEDQLEPELELVAEVVARLEACSVASSTRCG